MWDVKGKPENPSLFKPINPSKILYDFDGPRIFTFTNSDKDLFLAFQCDQSIAALRYIVVPFSQELESKLTDGEISVREALDQPRVWIVDIGKGWEIVESWSTKFKALPEDALPEVGTMLWPALQPLISLRAIGTHIGEGMTPGSVIRSAVDSVEKAIKVLVEYVLQLGQQAGRPSGAIRRLYDLPTQRLAFNSFEISFRRPIIGDQKIGEVGEAELEAQEAIYQHVGTLLQRGLEWITSIDHSLDQINDESEEWQVILRALESLAPSTYGAVRAVELRGDMIGELAFDRHPVRIEQGARRWIRQAQTQLGLSKERIVDPIGRVRETDKDRYTFELRDIEGAVEVIKFTFEEEFKEEVFDAFNGDYLVRVWGVEEPVKNLFSVVAIQKYGEDQSVLPSPSGA